MDITELNKYRDNPNVQQFLNILSFTEGTQDNGYNTLFGGGRFEDLSRHPNKKFSFKQTDGKTNTTSAAGRYQFLAPTWNRLSNKYKFPDFSPESQDLGAIALINEAGALDDVANGDFNTAISKTNRIWASLPGSPYAQKTRSIEDISEFLNKGQGNRNVFAPAVIRRNEVDNITGNIDVPQTQDINPPMPEDVDSNIRSGNPNNVYRLYGMGSREMNQANPDVYIPTASENSINPMWLNQYVQNLVRNG